MTVNAIRHNGSYTPARGWSRRRGIVSPPWADVARVHCRRAFAFFLLGWALSATGDHEDARAFAWRCVYEKRSPSHTAANTRLRNIQSELVGLACATPPR